jgi:UPF0755 protein
MNVRRRIVWIVTTVLLAIIVLAVGARLYYTAQLEPVSDSGETVQFVVESGESAEQIGANLQEQGLIRSGLVFKWYVSIHHVRAALQAGPYDLRPSMSTPDIVSVLTHGMITTDLVTILPGQRIDQVRETLIANGFNEEDVDNALDPAAHADHPVLADKPAGDSLEGYIYPESFQRGADTTAADIIEASLDEMNAALTSDVRAQFAAHGLSLHQGVILASMVEREAPEPERALVAQVFLKRLSMGIRFQSDPTAYYGAQLDGVPNSNHYDSPYNTYTRDGLPVGPISNVSRSSLEAVAHPANTDWLYFVAGSDGTTHYSRTIEEHEAAIDEYCVPRCGVQ